MPRASDAVIDAIGRAFPPGRYSRIVSLVPSLTETLIEASLANRLIGRTRFCVHPENRVGEIPIVGGTKTVDIDRVLELSPDLVLANREENTRSTVDELSRISRVFVTYPRTVAQVVEMLEDLGRLIGEPQLIATARGIAERVHGGGELEVRAHLDVVTLIWSGPSMALGMDTYASDLLEHAGARNALRRLDLPTERGRYPAVSLDDIVHASPDVLLLPDEPYRFDEKHADRLAHELSARAGREIPSACVDGELVTWFGFRTLRALPELTRTIGGIARRTRSR